MEIDVNTNRGDNTSKLLTMIRLVLHFVVQRACDFAWGLPGSTSRMGKVVE